MADQTVASDSNLTVDPYHHLQVAPNSDDTITRLEEYPNSPPVCDSKLPTPVLSEDILINQSNSIWVRLFLPRHVLDQSPSPTATATTKLPLLVFYQASYYHDFCVNLVIDAPVVIASAEHRLAPEHRLPATYDAMEALHWFQTAQDDWFTDCADLSNCFLMGASAGANIAYHAGLRADVGVDHLNPLKI